MTKTIELILTPKEAFDQQQFQQTIKEKLQLGEGQVFIPLKRSIDARGRKVIVRMQVQIYSMPDAQVPRPAPPDYPQVKDAREVVVVGAGPAGLFAALRLIELGLKPIVIERGKDVQSRRRDIAAINKDHVVNPDSNYCFGEGGAGTYSDGKLYTRSKKRGDVNRILQILVHHGAPDDILFDAHPHIGTNKLPKLVAALRATVQSAGGEIRFETKVTDIRISGRGITGVELNEKEIIPVEQVILATGHSARDMYTLLHKRGVLIEPKPFALGVRVEHPQELIDRIQYHCDVRDPYLPASAYALVHQVPVGAGTRGVFSFCMCPGGFIVPAATAPGEVVVNGMSPSRRDSRFANSGIVVGVEVTDSKAFSQFGPLAGMYFQAKIEETACQSAGGRQTAPAQRLMDFVQRKSSASLLDTSYQPGLASVEMDAILPSWVAEALRQGFKSFGAKMKGYLTNEAQVVGVESRTSAPVRIPRDHDTLEHLQIKGLFPCGEGAGFAGGIVSAAMDGERCAEAVGRKLGIRMVQYE